MSKLFKENLVELSSLRGKMKNGIVNKKLAADLLTVNLDNKNQLRLSLYSELFDIGFFLVWKSKIALCCQI